MPPIHTFLLLLTSLVSGAFADCWDENKCIFHQYKDGVITYSWDLRSLCNNGSGYTFTNLTTGQNYRFEICGSIDAQVPTAPGCDSTTGPCTIPGEIQTNTYCNPEYNAYPFEGNFLQFFDPNPARDCNRGACPNVGFLSPSLQNQQGYCCTGQCEIIAYGDAAYNYRWIDDNNVATGGIRWTAYGDAPDNGDEFQCPTDPNTGNRRARTLQVNMQCDLKGKRSDPLQTISFYDDGYCFYTVILSHFAACAVAGNPFDTNDDDSNSNSNSIGPNSIVISTSALNAYFFGYVVLGAAICVIVYYMYAFGDDRGWWNSIKDALPEGCCARKSVFSGAGYNKGSPSASAPLYG